MAPSQFGEAAREVERRGAAGVGGEQLVELGVEGRVFARFVVSDLKFFERRHQNFGSVTPAVSAEVPACVGLRSHVDRSAASINCFMRVWSLRPGDDSTPDATSTAQGFPGTLAMASRTLLGSQASGENQRPGEVRGPRPIICRAIDQDGFGGIVGHVGCGVFDAEGFPDADGAGMLRGCFVAVELRDIELKLRGDLFDDFGRFVDEDTDFPDVRRDVGDPRRELRGGGVARTWCVKDEAEGAGSGVDGGEGVFAIRDAADFHEHSGDQFLDGARCVSGFDEVLAYEEGVVSGVEESVDIGGGEDAAFADLREGRRDLRREGDRGFERDVEGAQIAVVDADDFGAGTQGDFEFAGVVDFDQRGHFEFAGEFAEGA